MNRIGPFAFRRRTAQGNHREHLPGAGPAIVPRSVRQHQRQIAASVPRTASPDRRRADPPRRSPYPPVRAGRRLQGPYGRVPTATIRPAGGAPRRTAPPRRGPAPGPCGVHQPRGGGITNRSGCGRAAPRCSPGARPVGRIRPTRPGRRRILFDNYTPYPCIRGRIGRSGISGILGIRVRIVCLLVADITRIRLLPYIRGDFPIRGQLGGTAQERQSLLKKAERCHHIHLQRHPRSAQRIVRRPHQRPGPRRARPFDDP